MITGAFISLYEDIKSGSLMEKHMVAAVIMRKAMQKAERIFKPAFTFLTKQDLEAMLEQFEQEFNEEILALLDQLLDRGWV